MSCLFENSHRTFYCSYRGSLGAPIFVRGHSLINFGPFIYHVPIPIGNKSKGFTTQGHNTYRSES